MIQRKACGILLLSVFVFLQWASLPPTKSRFLTSSKAWPPHVEREASFLAPLPLCLLPSMSSLSCPTRLWRGHLKPQIVFTRLPLKSSSVLCFLLSSDPLPFSSLVVIVCVASSAIFAVSMSLLLLPLVWTHRSAHPVGPGDGNRFLIEHPDSADQLRIWTMQRAAVSSHS